MLADGLTVEHVDAATVLRSGSGTIGFRWASSGVLVIRPAGEVDASIALQLATVLDERLLDASRPTTMCWDLAELDYLDPSVREVLTESVRCRRRHVRAVLVLAAAPWVRLGVSAAALALALTDVRVTDDRAAFEHEIAMAVVWRRRRTTVREVVGAMWACG